MPVSRSKQKTKRKNKVATKRSSYEARMLLNTSLIEDITFEGKLTIKAPVVMINNGVHNGLLYNESNLEETAVQWNGMPVVYYHTKTEDGSFESARTPENFEKSKVGTLFNTRYENDELVADLYLDIDKMNAIDSELIDNIRKGNMIEVSTGLTAKVEAINGIYNDEYYYGKAHDIKPDHLALLPEEVGACSIMDGAGFPRMNEEDSPIEVLAVVQTFITNIFKEIEFSADDKSRLIRRAIQGSLKVGSDQYLYIEDIFDEYLIYSIDFDRFPYSRYFKISYSVTKDGVVTIGTDSVETIRTVQYINNKDEIMNKKTKIDSMIANEKSRWVEGDREFLNGLNEENLDKMIEIVEVQNNVQPTESAPVTEKAITNESKKVVSIADYIAEAPDGIQEVLNEGISSMNREKSKYIANILSAEGTEFTKESLLLKPIGDLRMISNLVKPAVSSANEDTDYSLQGVGNQSLSPEGEDPLGVPDLLGTESAK